MTASTPRRLLPLGDDFPEPHMAGETADMGTTLGINEALQRRREALTPAAWLFLWPLAVLIAIASGAAIAFLYDYVLVTYF